MFIANLDNVLKLNLRPEFGSAQNGFRQCIRESLRQDLKELGVMVPEEILNLDQVPKPLGVSVSISHSYALGGYVISRTAIGFDIERTDRVTAEIAKRIAQNHESYPAADFLWVAKEAVFKLFQNKSKKIKVISAVQILDWEILGPSSAEFTYLGGQGLCWRQAGHTLAIAEAI